MVQFNVFVNIIFIQSVNVYGFEEDILQLFRTTSGYKLANNSFYFSENILPSTDQCGQECIDSAYCASFSYNKVSRQCLLSGIFANDISAFRRQPGMNHYQYRLSAFPVNLTLSWEYRPRIIATPDFPYLKLANSSFFLRLLVPDGYTIHVLFITLSIDRRICNSQQEGVTIDHGGIVLRQAVHLCDNRKINTPFMFSSGENIIQIRAISRTSRMMFKARYYFVKTINNSRTCDLLNCPVHSECRTRGSVSSCECFEGYIGRYCTLDPCSQKLCQNHTSCINMNGEAKCLCEGRFTGKYCDIKIDPCSSKPCIKGKCMVESKTRYSCECMDGYTGMNCETNINDCSSNPCPGSECIDGINQYYCTCPQCIHGLCLYKDGIPYCWCFPGFSGVNCSEDRNECSSNPCVYGNCTDYSNGYKCICESGFYGWNCDHYRQVKCQDDYCVNGKCIEYIPDIKTCVCLRGFTGKYCENKIAPCGSKCFKYCMESITNVSTETCLHRCAVLCDKHHITVPDNHNKDNGTTVTPKIRFSVITNTKNNNLNHKNNFVSTTHVNKNHHYATASTKPNNIENHTTLAPTTHVNVNHHYTTTSTKPQNLENQTAPTTSYTDNNYGIISSIKHYYSRIKTTVIPTVSINHKHHELFTNSTKHELLENKSTLPTKLSFKHNNLDNKTMVTPNPNFRLFTIYTEILICLTTCLHGHCIYNNGTFICRCFPGFRGLNCDNVIRLCPCVHGSCLNNVTTRCLCDPSYTGLYCDTEFSDSSCEKNQCVHGQCQEDVCMCEHQYTGHHCDTELMNSSCDDNQCVHGLCHGDVCMCEHRYTGNKCDVLLDTAINNISSKTNGLTLVLITVVIGTVILLIIGIIFIATRCIYQRGSVNFEQIRNCNKESYQKLFHSKEVNTEIEHCSTDTDLYDFPESIPGRETNKEEITKNTTHSISGVETSKSDV